MRVLLLWCFYEGCVRVIMVLFVRVFCEGLCEGPLVRVLMLQIINFICEGPYGGSLVRVCVWC